MGTTGLVPKIKDGDWVSVRQAIAKLSTKLGPASYPTYAGLTLTGLTATRLIATDASKALESTDLASWVTQTANQVLVADDTNGGIVLSTPQDIDTGADVEFSTLQLTNNIIVGNGSVSAPSYSFTNATDVGWYLSGSDGAWELNAALDGVKHFAIAQTDGYFFFKDSISANFAKLRFTGTAMSVNRNLAIDLNDGHRSIDFAGDLNVEGNSIINQDLTTDASPTFAGLTLDYAAQDYLFTSRSGSTLAIQSQTSNLNPILELYTKDGDGGDNEVVAFSLIGKGTPTDITTALEQIIFLYDTNGAHAKIFTHAAGTGTTPDLAIYTEANTTQLVLSTDNNVAMSGALTVTGNVTCAYSIASRLQGVGDVDTYLSLTADKFQFVAGGVEFITCAEVPGFPGDKLTFNIAGVDIDTIIEAVGQTHALFVHGADGNVGVRTSSPTILFSVTEKGGITSIGGYVIKLTNKTGGNTIAGQLVIASTGTDDAFATAGANSDAVIGIVLDAGIADGSEAWVIEGGIADVLIDGGGCTHGDRMISSATAGSADVWNTGGAVATHFLEIGHCLETRVGAGLARVKLHFN